jgi:membrane glycosyltransferase
MGLSAYAVSLPLMLWMLPVLLGLVLALPLGLLTSVRPRTAGVFATPEDRLPAPVLIRARELAASHPHEIKSALDKLRENGELLRHHLASLSQASRPGTKQIDVPLAVARAKLDECKTFEEAVAWLENREIRAVLNDPSLLQRILQMSSSRLPYIRVEALS